MALKRITAPTLLVVSLVEAKAHLRVDVSDDDDLITACIHSATALAEQYTNRAIAPQTWELTLDAFPTAFELTRTPVTSTRSPARCARASAFAATAWAWSLPTVSNAGS